MLPRLGLYPMCPADDTWLKLPARVEATVLGMELEDFKATLKDML